VLPLPLPLLLIEIRHAVLPTVRVCTSGDALPRILTIGGQPPQPLRQSPNRYCSSSVACSQSHANAHASNAQHTTTSSSVACAVFLAAIPSTKSESLAFALTSRPRSPAAYPLLTRLPELRDSATRDTLHTTPACRSQLLVSRDARKVAHHAVHGHAQSHAHSARAQRRAPARRHTDTDTRARLGEARLDLVVETV
jgi:hypothetical protein